MRACKCISFIAICNQQRSIDHVSWLSPLLAFHEKAASLICHRPTLHWCRFGTQKADLETSQGQACEKRRQLHLHRGHRGFSGIPSSHLGKILEGGRRVLAMAVDSSSTGVGDRRNEEEEVSQHRELPHRCKAGAHQPTAHLDGGVDVGLH